jgi:hypothetical protein
LTKEPRRSHKDPGEVPKQSKNPKRNKDRENP